MRQNFLRVLLYVMLLGIPLSVRSVNWVPVGDHMHNGFAVGADNLYHQGDNIDDAQHSYNNKSFYATADDNVLDLFGTLYTDYDAMTQVAGPIACPLKINGNITIEAVDVDATVNVNEDTVIIPFCDNQYTLSNGAGYSQVFFNTALGRTIDVNMYYDLTFSGTTPNVETYQDMIVTFAGPGMVRFNMDNGTALWFDGQIDKTDAAGTAVGGLTLNQDTGLFEWAQDDPSSSIGINSGGCKVFVTMDQYPEEVDAGNCKVLFQRFTPVASPTRAPVEQDARVMVYFGPNAIFTYLSDNDSGLWDGNPESQTYFPDGYARVAFDPSCNMFDGIAGRMVLFIRGAYDTNPQSYDEIVSKYPMNDGGVLINGHYCWYRSGEEGEFVPEDIVGYDQDAQEIYYGYDYSMPAGVGAKFMVFDKAYYDGHGEENPYNPNPEDRRGLLVINDCQNHSKLFADPYWDTQEGDGSFPYDGPYQGAQWAQSNPVNAEIATRRGFVLGINGEVEIYPNTFLDHVCGAVNQVDPFAEYDAQYVWDPALDLSFLKKRNPSALIFDGLDPSLFAPDSGNPLNEGIPSNFVAADPYLYNNDQVRAMVSLYGDGALYSRACASSAYGYLYKYFNAYDYESFDDSMHDYWIDYTGALDNGVSTYDGYQLLPNEDTIQEGEGNHVYDFEGEAWIQGLWNDETVDMTTGDWRWYTEQYTNSGVFSAPTVLIDDTGHEVLVEDASYVWFDRPLLNDGTEYTRYNSPTIFFNNFGIFFNAIFKHTDATKYVNGVPAFSEPAITGGERYYFGWEGWTAGTDDYFWNLDPNRYRVPELRFIGQPTLELHESCCMSGVRFATLDVPNAVDSSGDTYAAVTFFDHGDPLDTMLTGYGRVWMFGSNMNLMADDSRNYSTDSCYLNIFKHNLTTGVEDPVNNASRVRLYLDNGDEFDPSVPETQYSLQRAHHLISFAQPDEDIAGAIVNAKIGWFTKQGDGSVFPGSYPYNDEVMSTEPSDLFENNALVTPNSRLYIDGSFMCFSSFDKFGNSLPMPIITNDDNGVMYVNSGGRLSVLENEGDIHTTLQNHAVVSTGVARQIWNDSDATGITERFEYSGQIYMPFDQVKFDPNYSVQIYNITSQMWEDPQNPSTGTSGVRIFPQEGEEEMGIAWFYRELQNPLNYIPVKYPDTKAFNLRLTESPNAPVAETNDVIYFGGGDVIQQLKVFGATQSDPLHLGISGDGYTSPFYCDVREIVSCKSEAGQVTDRFISEGAHGVLFVELGGQVRLGSNDWNNHSVEAWNKLGKDYVTIVPLRGGGTVVLNDNLLVTARMALVAGTTFGLNSPDRLSFYSENDYEIRVTAGVELDFSSFGQTGYMQEIEFGGKIRLVLEAGATIRMPQNGSNVALYFNDESEMIFEAPDALASYVPFTNAEMADYYTTKIVGKGSIYVNKDAKILINDNARVRIGSDDLTPNTDIIFSLTRNGQLNIGNDTTAGGVLEIGNYAYVSNSTIKTKFALYDDSIFNIAREGCLALSAIVVNKNSNPNGLAVVDNNPVMDTDNPGVAKCDDLGRPVFNPDIAPSSGAWSFIPAYNVNRIEFELAGGTLDHKNIVDGQSSNSSLVVVGPSMSTDEGDGYFFKLNGPANAGVLGGGNVMYIPNLQEGQTVYTANIWNYQGAVSTGESYAILASGLSLLEQTEMFPTVSQNYGVGGKSFSFTTASAPVDFFNFMSLVPFDRQGKEFGKKVDFAITVFDSLMAYPSRGLSTIYASTTYTIPSLGAEIFRQSAPPSVGGGTYAEAAEYGSLGCVGNIDGFKPVNFSVTR